MEYFLPLSVMAMIISSISIFLIDNQNPTSNTDPENDQSSSSSEKIDEDPVDEFTVLENKENLQKSSNNPKDISDESTLNKIHSTHAILRAFQKTFSMLWNSTPKSKLTTSQS